MKKKRDIINFLLFFAFTFLFVGCAGDTDIPQTEKTEISPEPSVQEAAEESEVKAEETKAEETKAEKEEILLERHEISIDFPFYGDQKEDKLTLAAPQEGQDEFELIHYDKDGEILQQIPCGRLMEPVTFSFIWDDLQIFSEGSDTGILFIWDDGSFSTTPIEIPRYEEVRYNGMLVLEEDVKLCEKQIYLLNRGKNRVEKARNFRLQKDTATLTIRDELEHVNLFEGAVRLDENGNPVNEEYFDMLLWDDLNNPSRSYDEEEEAPIYTWVGEEPKQREEGEEIKIGSFDEVQNNFFGNAGHSQEYESRQAFLSDFGFENCEPVYQYFDRYGNVQLELYADEDMNEICGITYYTHRFNTELEKVERVRNAFSICSILEAEWNGQDPFMLKSVYGTSAENDSYVVDYEESTEYTDSGKPDLFVGRGRLTDRDEEENMLKINFIYREDDTLFCREYSHHDLVFGSTKCSMHSFYDEKERIIFESSYITHGHEEYYYIYDDRDGKLADKPAYILYIDQNLNYAIPTMIKCL